MKKSIETDTENSVKVEIDRDSDIFVREIKIKRFLCVCDKVEKGEKNYWFNEKKERREEILKIKLKTRKSTRKNLKKYWKTEVEKTKNIWKIDSSAKVKDFIATLLEAEREKKAEAVVLVASERGEIYWKTDDDGHSLHRSFIVIWSRLFVRCRTVSSSTQNASSLLLGILLAFSAHTSWKATRCLLKYHGQQ